MIVGHTKIMATGEDNCGRNVPYELSHHYVSDYAKHPEHGWIIKSAIGVFCVCIVLVLWDHGTVMAAGDHPRRLVWLLFLGAAMVGGLTLVALYDNRSMTTWARCQDSLYKSYEWMSLPDWEFVRKLLGRDDEAIDKIHDRGFGIFAVGFILLVVTSAWVKWNSGLGMAKKTLTFLLVIALLLLWASCLESFVDNCMPGIPQRILLIGIAGWLLLSHIRYSRPSTIRDT